MPMQSICLVDSSTNSGRRFSIGVIAMSAVITALATCFGIFALDNALDGRIRDRTIWGIALMVLAALSWPVFLLVIARRRRFHGKTSHARWLAAWLFPGVFYFAWALAFGMYANLDDVSARPLLPHTPRLTFKFVPTGPPQIETRGAFGGSESGGSVTHADGKRVGPMPFHYRTFNFNPQTAVVAITGQVAESSSVNHSVTMELALGQTTRVRFAGLNNLAVMVNGAASSHEVDLPAGSYKIVVTGDFLP